LPDNFKTAAGRVLITLDDFYLQTLINQSERCITNVSRLSAEKNRTCATFRKHQVGQF